MRGSGLAGRGGSGIVQRMGRQESDGTDGFKEHRPGWDMPVHQLLVRNHLAAVFKAHDNFFARQELEGIVYQMIPQPSFAGNDRIRELETYGYKQGIFIGNSGHVRVTISPEKVRVEYVRSYLPKNAIQAHPNGEISSSYEIIASARPRIIRPPSPVPAEIIHPPVTFLQLNRRDDGCQQLAAGFQGGGREAVFLGEDQLDASRPEFFPQNAVLFLKVLDHVMLLPVHPASKGHEQEMPRVLDHGRNLTLGDSLRESCRCAGLNRRRGARRTDRGSDYARGSFRDARPDAEESTHAGPGSDEKHETTDNAPIVHGSLRFPMIYQVSTTTMMWFSLLDLGSDVGSYGLRIAPRTLTRTK